MLDGLEITQFTYFQQCGGIDLDLVPAEMTYGLERLAAFLQVKDSVYDIEWAPGVKYRDVRFADELQYSVYNFEMADVDDAVEAVRPAREAKRSGCWSSTIRSRRRSSAFRCCRTYDQVLKCSHLFNTLDSRGSDQRDRAGRRDRARAQTGGGRGAGVGRISRSGRGGRRLQVESA